MSERDWMQVPSGGTLDDYARHCAEVARYGHRWVTFPGDPYRVDPENYAHCQHCGTPLVLVWGLNPGHCVADNVLERCPARAEVVP